MLLDWRKTEELLKKYQIPLVESLLIENAEQGIKFANRVGFPVVLKLLSPGDLHKTDKGLVKLNIQNEQQLESAFVILTTPSVILRQQPKDLGDSSAIRPQNDNRKRIIIQKQVSGLELFMGIKRDQSFGPVISFGLGGIFVEALEDIVLGICPISKKEAAEMIKSIKGYKILQGYRGQKPIDIEKLADVLVNVANLAMENKEIKEIDFNPVFAAGNNIIVADAKII